MSTITETCACGAKFAATSEFMSTLNDAAKRWRDGHQHAESVGICGDQAPHIEGLEPLWCVLKAGHVGAHQGQGDGGHWMKREPPAPRQRFPLARRRA